MTAWLYAHAQVESQQAPSRTCRLSTSPTATHQWGIVSRLYEMSTVTQYGFIIFDWAAQRFFSLTINRITGSQYLHQGLRFACLVERYRFIIPQKNRTVVAIDTFTDTRKAVSRIFCRTGHYCQLYLNNGGFCLNTGSRFRELLLLKCISYCSQDAIFVEQCIDSSLLNDESLQPMQCSFTCHLSRVREGNR